MSAIPAAAIVQRSSGLARNDRPVSSAPVPTRTMEIGRRHDERPDPGVLAGRAEQHVHRAEGDARTDRQRQDLTSRRGRRSERIGMVWSTGDQYDGDQRGRHPDQCARWTVVRR